MTLPTPEASFQANVYQHLAARTLIDEPDVPLSGKETMIIWNITGLAGETGELIAATGAHSMTPLAERIWQGPSADRSKILEELGDVLWYMAGTCTKLGIHFSDITDNQAAPTRMLIEHIACVAVYSGHVVDHIKKGIFHRHGVSVIAAVKELRALYQSLLGLAEYFQIDIGAAAGMNIAKLQKRYPEGYTSADSINRQA